jgi:hypothetical protein
MNDPGPFTPEQQAVLLTLGEMAATVFDKALEVRINVAAMQKLLKQRNILTEDEWETAVARNGGAIAN